MKVLITRPRYQSEHLIRSLKEEGYETELMPLLDINPIEYSLSDKSKWVELLRQADFIISVSANAARLSLLLLSAMIESIDDESGEFKKLYAIGPATAKIFSGAGLTACVPESQYNSESLLALPDFNQLENKKVVILCGEGGRDYLEQKLNEMGAISERIELYTRIPIFYKPLDQVSNPTPDVLTAMSGDTLNALASVIDSSNDFVRKKWKTLPLIVPSERVARIATERSFTKIYITAKPTSDSLLAVLGQLEKPV